MGGWRWGGVGVDFAGICHRFDMCRNINAEQLGRNERMSVFLWCTRILQLQSEGSCFGFHSVGLHEAMLAVFQMT